ncbi:MAG: Very short patch repair protein [Bacteroidetes bacterium ADurb.Bin408]|nr:MAG: Very short patch repair protein [Bacteroidetes bacterium ADurb.Bin408]
MRLILIILYIFYNKQPANRQPANQQPATIYLCPMADVHDTQTRSYNMSRIKGKDTKPELLVRKFLHAHGFRYKLHDTNLPGKPDLVLPKYKTVIFIHGCFWHGHTNCRYFVVPKTRTDWWLNKINTNRANDAKAVKALKKDGWKIITVWECRLKPAKAASTLAALLKKLS